MRGNKLGASFFFFNFRDKSFSFLSSFFPFYFFILSFLLTSLNFNGRRGWGGRGARLVTPTSSVLPTRVRKKGRSKKGRKWTTLFEAQKERISYPHPFEN